MAINYNGDICVVQDSQHRTPGNLRAFVQASLRSIRSGRSSDVRFSSTEKIDVIPMMTRKMDFSYKDVDDFVFSDPDTFETVTLPPEIIGDAKNYLVENAQVTVTFDGFEGDRHSGQTLLSGGRTPLLPARHSDQKRPADIDCVGGRDGAHPGGAGRARTPAGMAGR